MKKKLQFVLAAMLSLSMACMHAQDIPFKVRFSTAAASCYNNGKILYALTDSEGEIMDSLPAGLSQVRIYHRLSLADTIHYAGWYYTGGLDTLTIGEGTYIVGVEGLLDDGGGGYVRVDTQTVLTVVTNYVKPEASALTEVVSSLTMAGNMPSLSCMNTGRVQLSIVKGRFPYTVTVCDHESGDTLRTQVFDGPQHQGTVGYFADYRNYYTFDTMPVGNWDFYLVDGCGYGLPRFNQDVQETSLPKLKSIQLYTSSGNFADTNVVRINAELDKRVDPFTDYYHQYASFRLVYHGLATTPWKPVQLIGGSTLYICDTVAAADKYCDIWDKEITLEYKLIGCEEWENAISFYLNKPNDIYFQKDTANTTYVLDGVSDPCGVELAWRRANYNIRYYCDTYSDGIYAPLNCYLAGYSRYSHAYYRYYYTHPLTWIYTDTQTGAVIKKDTIDIITDLSYLHDYEVEAVYGSFQDTVLRIPVNRTLLDRKGCVLYDTHDTLVFYHYHGRAQDAWAISQKEDVGHCCDESRYVTLSRVAAFPAPVPTKVRLVRSPDHNLYNFEATYNPETEMWTVRKDHAGNGAVVDGRRDGNTLSLRDYCLPGGIYTFEILTPCDTFILTKTIEYPDIYLMEIEERPAYTVTRDCGTTYVTYTAGRYRRTKLQRDYAEDRVDTIFEYYYPRISIIKGLSSGISPDYALNRPIRLSMEGQYVFRISIDANYISDCEWITIYDTFNFEKQTVEFEYAQALLCDSTSTSGNAYVKGKNGTEPYTYTLYSGPDKQGNVLGINHTGVFTDVPMRSDQQLSCLVEDSCRAYFHVNFYPRTLAAMQKVWFDGGMTAARACEGDTIQVHALAIGDVLQYDWSGPGGFRASTAEPYVFIQRGGASGWYRVTIADERCGQTIMDSIFLTVQESPSLTVKPDATVCPGETVEVTFTPQNADNTGTVDFSVVFDNGLDKVVRQYSANAQDIVTDQFVAYADTKIYPIWINDGRCDYWNQGSGDTAYIRLRTDMARACTVLTTYDTVCAGGTARLTARSTIDVPYTLRWYNDYALTGLLKTDDIGDEVTWSQYDTTGITQRTMLYVAVEKEGMCPSVNGMATYEMNMKDGNTVLDCGQVCRLYDAGGPADHYPVLGESVHRFHSADGRPLVLRFDMLDLSTTSHLWIYSGVEMVQDSLMMDLSRGSWYPELIVSKGNTFTLHFKSGSVSAAGWSATVEPSPGIAIADVWPKKETLLHDEVCQSQTREYDDPYGMVPEIASAEELNLAIRRAGNHYFSKTYVGAGEHGCDSTVIFELSVLPPVTRDTTVIMFATPGQVCHWRDSLFTESGHYAMLATRPDGCDSLDVLHLLILDTQVWSEDVCKGETAYLEVSTSMEEEERRSVLIPTQAQVGDVLCTDGSILPFTVFAQSGKTPKGVVFHVDRSGMHGLAVALTETTAPLAISMRSSSLILRSSLEEALWDMDGLMNTWRIRNAVNVATNTNFDEHALAAKYCYYYDSQISDVGAMPSGWYLPAIGELNLLYVSRMKINQTLNRLAALQHLVTPMPPSSYWSSSAASGGKFWIITQAGGVSSASIGSSYTARPIIAF